MAPRANWKGFLRLSLVTCPVALYPATSESEKISFNQINKKTGHRVKYLKVDADTGEVSNDEIIKGYKVDTDTYVEMSKEELENIALESTRTIDIDEFVPKSSIDPRYLIRPYYLVPDGKVGHDAYAVIRETIRSMNMVAIGRVVLTSREHIIGLEPLDKGLMGTLIRYPYEVRDEHQYFDEIQDVKVTKDMAATFTALRATARRPANDTRSVHDLFRWLQRFNVTVCRLHFRAWALYLISLGPLGLTSSRASIGATSLEAS
jgi:DNA end-binding protein Ku